MDELNPMILFSTIEALIGRQEGLEPSYGIEVALAGYARARKLTIASLESAESQMATLIGPNDQVTSEEVEDSLSQLEDGTTRKITERLALTWSEGKLDDLTQYTTWCQCMDSKVERDEMKRLLDDRNSPLAEGIDKLHRQGKSVFAAVGALHMVGDSGLPALLQRKGYTVSPVVFGQR